MDTNRTRPGGEGNLEPAAVELEVAFRQTGRSLARLRSGLAAGFVLLWLGIGGWSAWRGAVGILILALLFAGISVSLGCLVSFLLTRAFSRRRALALRERLDRLPPEQRSTLLQLLTVETGEAGELAFTILRED